MYEYMTHMNAMYVEPCKVTDLQTTRREENQVYVNCSRQHIVSSSNLLLSVLVKKNPHKLG